jgi:hypothetical protein
MGQNKIKNLVLTADAAMEMAKILERLKMWEDSV